jgi:hypothetical protein
MNKTEEIRKIKKLQALATSSYPHEAQAARSKADILMKVHGVTQAEVDAHDLHEGDVSHLVLRAKFKLAVEDKFLAPLLEKFFHVIILTRRKGHQKEVFAVGRPQQLPKAKKAYDHLQQEFRSKWRSYRKISGKPEVSRQSFYLGLFEAVKKVLGDMDVETQALQVCVTDIVEKMGADEPTGKGFDFPMDDMEAMKEGYFQGLKSGILKVYLNRDI